MQSVATPSIRRHLLKNMVLPVSVLAILLGIGGAVLIHSVVSLAQDRLLDAGLVAIIERADVRGIERLDDALTSDAIKILGGETSDTFAFSVSDGDRFLRGNRTLSEVNAGEVPIGRIAHAHAEINDTKMRLAMTRGVIAGYPRPLVFKVSETLSSRLNMEARMLVALILFEAVLLSAAGILSYMAILRGLLPLTEISQELLGRATPGAVGFSRIDTARVPEEAVDLVSAINKLMERLDETVAGVRDFTGDASHQLRSPLGAIRLHLELLERQAAGQTDILATLAEAQNGVARLQRLLQQLIVLARADTDSDGLDLNQRVDLGQLAANVLAERAPYALKRDTEIVLDTPDDPVEVLGNPLLLREIIANLVDNAVAHSPHGGSVKTRITAQGVVGIIAIEDEGPGIPEDERVRVFQRFYQIARVDGEPGSGLGLAIVRRLADLHGGSVTLSDPASGRGLTVEVSIRLWRS